MTHSGVAPFIQHAGRCRGAATPRRWSGSAPIAPPGRDLTGEALSGLNRVRYSPPDGAFYAFVGVEGLTDSFALAKRLVLDHRVAVAPGVAFGAAGEGYLRICFAQSADRIERAMDRLRDGIRSAAVIGPGSTPRRSRRWSRR